MACESWEQKYRNRNVRRIQTLSVMQHSLNKVPPQTSIVLSQTNQSYTLGCCTHPAPVCVPLWPCPSQPSIESPALKIKEHKRIEKWWAKKMKIKRKSVDHIRIIQSLKTQNIVTAKLSIYFHLLVPRLHGGKGLELLSLQLHSFVFVLLHHLVQRRHALHRQRKNGNRQC